MTLVNSLLLELWNSIPPHVFNPPLRLSFALSTHCSSSSSSRVSL